jgi:putative permease
MLKIFQNWFNRYFSDEEALFLFLFLAVGLVVALLLGSILAPVFASLILAYLMMGLVHWLERFSIPHLISVWGIYLIFIGILALFIVLFLPMVWQQMTRFLGDLPSMLIQLQYMLMIIPERYPNLISATQIDAIMNIIMAEIGNSGQWLFTFSLASIGQSITLLLYLVLVPILVFFFLKDNQLLLSWFSQLLPTRRNLLNNVWLEMDQQIANYARGKVVEIFIVGAITYIVFLWLDLNYAELLALLVGLSVLVPYVGAVLVTIPVVLVGLFQFGWSADYATVLIAYLIIQGMDGNVLVPMLFSEAVNLHPVAIIVAILLFGGMWGVWGVFFAIPLATLIKAVMHAWPRYQSEDLM